MNRLKGFDLLALGFMTFALFLGAGNIIFPPSAGMAAGEFIWRAALGFLLTGVGLPLLTVVALGPEVSRRVPFLLTLYFVSLYIYLQWR